jgi:hypothetical protein
MLFTHLLGLSDQRTNIIHPNTLAKGEMAKMPESEAPGVPEEPDGVEGYEGCDVSDVFEVFKGFFLFLGLGGIV